MKRAFYDEMPSTLEAVGNGSYLYRWDIQEEEKTVTEHSTSDGETVTAQESSKQYSCFEVTIWSPVSSNKILEAVIAAMWPNNREQKLINDYNAATLGCFGTKSGEKAQSAINAYKAFLTERDAIKAQVDADCESLNIN